MSWVIGLSELGSGIEQVGGKALNLGILTAAGFDVPEGFCVTTAAYRQIVGAQLDQVLVELDRGGEARPVRDRVLGLVMPDELRAVILQHYHQLGTAAAVAVRSSATAEDLAYASFAGQQDTYLDVVGDEAVLDAVRRCWASLWTDRAVSYRARQGIAHATVSLAVVVQRMVDARVAGVMFTANPVTGTRHETVIDASPGLGEAVVSGAVNPDHFVLDRARRSIRERQLADGGGSACLTDAQVLALSALGERVQDHYGSPQDTEWAIDGDGRIWLTQARAITTLYPQPSPDPPGSAVGGTDLRILACLSLAQGLTRPITPMGLASFRLIGSSVAAVLGHPVDRPLAGPVVFHAWGQRVYVDVTAVFRNRLGRRLMLGALSVMESRAAAVLRQLTERPEFALQPTPADQTLQVVARIVARTALPARFVVAAASPRLARAWIARTEWQLRARLVVPSGLSATERLDRVEQRLGHDIILLMPKVFAFAGCGFLLLALARRLLGQLAEPGEVQQIQRSLPYNVTTQMDLDLWELGAVSPEAAPRALASFLVRYGHRAVAEIDLGMPRWSEDPAHLIGVIDNYRRLSDPELAPDAQFRRGAAAAEAMIITLTERARRRSRLRGRLVHWCLGRARELTGLRESPKYLLVLALAAMRAQLLRVGRELHAEGRISREDDVFFLDFDEARRGLGGVDLRAVVADRREAYEVELRRRHIPRLLLSDGTEPEAVQTVSDRPDGSLLGTPASVGVVTGSARVVLEPVGAQLEPGEILVAPSTDPGWTPLFLTAGGLVMEMGGPNSHGAVVAREYGIPAVVGVPDATHRIRTGQRVTVDGAAGLVSPAAGQDIAAEAR